jgi:ElaB/YqjD/DUF883 family membrane-anchored ribosome-binding protein
MGQSTEELSGEIAETRRSLASDLDALQDRVSPSSIVERRKAAAKGRVRHLRQRVMGTVHDVRDTTTSGMSSAGGSVQDRYDGAPLAAGLVAFGAGMVIASLFPASEREAVAAGNVVDAAKERGEPMLEEAKGQAQQVAQEVRSAAESVRDEARG